MVPDGSEILLAGVGGQGIIFAGQVIMNAAIREGFRVYGFEEHGMARRGGAVASHIRFGEDIYSPMIPIGKGGLLAAFEPSEALKHLRYMSRDATVILNKRPVIPPSVSSGKYNYPDIEEIIDVITKRCKIILIFDATSLAKEVGNPIIMNVVVLGAICASSALPLKKEVMKEIIKSRSPTYARDLNLDAFEKGFQEIMKVE